MTQSTSAARTGGDSASLSKQRLKLWLNMLRTARHIELVLRERLKADFDATLPRFDVMAALFRSEEGMTMTKLSQQLMVSNGNVTGIVDRLEEDGFVTRFTNERDRRATLVALTAMGREAFSKMAQAHQVWIDELLQTYDAGEVEALTDMLQILRDDQRASEKQKQRKKRE